MVDRASDHPLDLSSLRAAVQALGNSIDVVTSPEFAVADPRWRDTLNAGVVQHFEFTFELCWKMLKRQLERELPSSAELDSTSYRDLLRLGQQRGLIGTIEPWFEFRELRNITAHTYARDKALKVVNGAPAMHAHANALLAAIEARNHG
jgi:nucleotidyltransferase substrate binding protein (TIGR01987 family)